MFLCCNNRARSTWALCVRILPLALREETSHFGETYWYTITVNRQVAGLQTTDLGGRTLQYRIPPDPHTIQQSVNVAQRKCKLQICVTVVILFIS